MRLAAATALIGCPSLLTTAWAAGRTAELATGGLLLPKTAEIEIKLEDLFISPRQIRATYHLRNPGSDEVRSLIVFPMPDVTVSDAATDVSLPTDDPKNLLGFTALVDGKPVKLNVVQKAFARGMDRTAELERLNVPLAPHLEKTDKALRRVQPADGEDLTKKGLTVVEEHSVGRGMLKQLSPRWTLRTTHYWQQKFPAGKEVKIEQRYKPSIGRSAQTLLGDPETMKDAWFKAYSRKYCLDDAFLAAVAQARQKAKSQHGAPFSEQRISYLLATGANWERPIGDLHIVVDTGSASSLISFCGEGVKKISPTRYEMRKTDYSPSRDLHILILKPTREAAGRSSHKAN
ncbi:MAG TPA: DUF4424 family protein [Hyphomicrobiaceae bacterium]|nr:DUF4424 family protein [Hyphomicrobiaceae bacterium]